MDAEDLEPQAGSRGKRRAGSISYSATIKPLSDGYAASSTDRGHQAATTSDGEWALGHYDRIVNFADRAMHLMAEADKVILDWFYAARLLNRLRMAHQT